MADENYEGEEAPVAQRLVAEDDGTVLTAAQAEREREFDDQHRDANSWRDHN